MKFTGKNLPKGFYRKIYKKCAENLPKKIFLPKKKITEKIFFTEKNIFCKKKYFTENLPKY